MKRKTFKVLGLFGLGLALYCLLVCYEHGYRLSWGRGITHVPIVRPGMVEDGGLRVSIDGAARNEGVIQARVRLQEVRLRLGEQRQPGKTIPLAVVFWGIDLASPDEQAEGVPVGACELDEATLETTIEFELPEGATHFAVAAGPNLRTGKLPVPR